MIETRPLNSRIDQGRKRPPASPDTSTDAALSSLFRLVDCHRCSQGFVGVGKGKDVEAAPGVAVGPNTDVGRGVRLEAPGAGGAAPPADF